MTPRFLSTQDPARGSLVSSPGKNLVQIGVMRQEVLSMEQFEGA